MAGEEGTGEAEAETEAARGAWAAGKVAAAKREEVAVGATAEATAEELVQAEEGRAEAALAGGW
jgi:hypothetical protein